MRASQKRMVLSLVAAATVPMMLLSAVIAFWKAEDDRTREERRVITRVDRIVERIHEAIFAELQIAQALAELPSLDQAHLDLFYQSAQRIVAQRQHWETSSLVGLDGQQVMNVLRPLGDPLGPVADRKAFQKSLDTRQPTIGGLGPVGPVSRKQLVSLFVPVIRNGEIKFILTVGIPPDKIRNIVHLAGVPSDWSGAIVDLDENVVVEADQGPNLRFPAMRDAKRSGVSETSSAFLEREQDGVSYSVIYRSIPEPTGWTVYFAIPTEKLNGEISKSTLYLALACILAVFITGGIANLIGKNIEEAREAEELFARWKIQSSEARASLATMAADLGTWRLNLATGFFTGSERTKSLLCLENTSQVGSEYIWHAQSFLDAVRPEDRARVQAVLDAGSKGTDSLMVEFRISTPDHSDRWLRLVGRKTSSVGNQQDAIEDADTIYGVLADVHILRTAETHRVQLLQRLAQEQEKIQRSIARELHDQVGQTLTCMSLGLRKLRQTTQNDAHWLEIDALVALTNDVSRDIHRVATDLRPLVLDDLGLEQALEALAKDLSARHETGFSVHTSLSRIELSSDLQVAVYRVVQEAFTNVLKHARAKLASAVINIHGHELRIVVDDDGQGLLPETGAAAARPPRRNKENFASIRERLAALGGGLQIESVPGQGLSLFMRIPLEPHRVMKNADTRHLG